MKLPWLLLPFLASLLSANLRAQTPTPDLKNPEALLAAAHATNGLAGDDLKPWHLKATYDVFDAYGKPVATGEFEEWWAAKDKWKRSYTGTHYTGTEYHLPEGVAHEPEGWKPVPWPESQIAEALVSPIRLQDKPVTLYDDKGPHTVNPPRLAIHSSGGRPPLSCVEAVRGFGDQYSAFGSYCFDPGTAELRLKVNTTQSLYNKIATFQGRIVSLELIISCNANPVLNVHVKSLASFAPEGSPVFRPASPPTPENEPLKIQPGALAGRKISGSEPPYPDDAKAQHEQGVVILGATIDKQGALADIQVLESPNLSFSRISLKTVSTWKYKPFIRNGSPVENPTTIILNFNLGR